MLLGSRNPKQIPNEDLEMNMFLGQKLRNRRQISCFIFYFLDITTKIKFCLPKWVVKWAAV